MPLSCAIAFEISKLVRKKPTRKWMFINHSTFLAKDMAAVVSCVKIFPVSNI